MKLAKIFSELRPCPHVEYFTLGYGATRLPVKGVGTIHIKVDKYILKLINIPYVPYLEESLFRIKRHMRIQGCSQHADDEYNLAFTTFVITENVDVEITFTRTLPNNLTLMRSKQSLRIFPILTKDIMSII